MNVRYTTKKFILIIVMLMSILGCHKENNINIASNIFIKEDKADRVYILVEEKSSSEDVYIVVGNIKWTKLEKNYIYGYKESYKTRTFLITEESYYFVIDLEKLKKTDYTPNTFPNYESMLKYLQTKNCSDNNPFLFVNPN